MEGCLLCLEINKEFVDCIKVDSAQWQELNIQYLIQKHLWTLESIQLSSWLCNSCWQELYDFHKFYMRIEESHMDFGKLQKKESLLQEYKEEAEEFHNDEECKILFNVPPLEHEIVGDFLLMEDHKTVVKVEQFEELGENNMTIIPRRERKCKSNSLTNNIDNSRKDPLKNTKQSPKNNKTNDSDQLTTSDTLLMLDDTSEIVVSSSDSDDSYTDSDNELVGKVAKSIKLTKTNPRPKRDNSKLQGKDLFLSENFKITCVLCEIPTTSFRELLKHFKTDHKERGYAVCCKRKFYKRTPLLEHVHLHVDPNYFKCNQCGKRLYTHKTLKAHKLLHLSEEEKNCICNECGKNFRNKVSLSQHIKIQHIKKYVKICDLCGKSLADNDKFQRHMLEHEGKPVPTFACTICGRRYIDKCSISRHMRLKHEPTKNDFNCHICSKKLASKDNLNKHIKYIHEGRNAIKCTICEKSFSRPKALKDHMTIHTGNPLYSCPWCPKKFYSNGNMYTHRKEVHPKEWEVAQREKFSGNSPPKSESGAVTDLCN